MNYKLFLSVFILTLFGIVACSDLNDTIDVNESAGIHSPGFAVYGSDDFHSYWFKSNAWDVRQCKSCHGSDYAGGTTGSSCLTCHTGSNGPEQCNTCHGSFADQSFIAPPQDLADETVSTAPGVGSHYNHYYNNSLSEQPSSCFDCHIQRTGETGKYVYDHIYNGGKAEIEFGGMALPIEGASSPEYNYEQYTCANTYCHGNFDFGGKIGNNKTVTFNTVDGSQAFCGSCHGQEIDGVVSPLPVGHFGTFLKEQCSMCHGTVVDETGTIIDKSKHINGEVNL